MRLNPLKDLNEISLVGTSLVKLSIDHLLPRGRKTEINKNILRSICPNANSSKKLPETLFALNKATS